MGNAWRVIVDDSLPGIENMARDAAILDRAEQSAKPMTTVRFYRWIIPTLSLGNKQDPEKAASLDFCRKNGLDIVRRPTGGGAVLHHLELTYSVVSNDKHFFPHNSILENYLLIAKALCRGLKILGLPAEMVNHTNGTDGREDNYIQNPVPCFSSPSHYELLVKGKKIIGSAQKRLKNAFLQHGSIPNQYDWDLQAGSMKSSVERLREVMTCISEHTSVVPGYRSLVEAFLQGFAESFQAKFIIEPMEEAELASAAAMLDEFKVSY